MGNYKPRNKNQKQEILFTAGKELMYIDGTEYIGYYYKSGPYNYVYDYKAQENKNTTTILLDYTTDKTKIEYFNLQRQFFNKFTKPVTSYPTPTKNEYEQGSINRYFVSNKCNGDIIEINEEAFNNIDTQSNNYKKINANLYESFVVQWKVKGPMYDVYQGNILIDYGIIDTNKRTVIQLTKTYPKIEKVLKDYAELANLF